MEGKIEYTGEKKCFSPVVRILLMSVTYSTVTDIKTVVKRCYDVRMTVYRSFSSLYLPRTVQVLQQKQAELSTQPRLTHTRSMTLAVWLV